MKVSIIGAGRVGSTTAFILMERGLCSEIALVDVMGERADGEALDLTHGVSAVKEDVLLSGSSDYSITKDSDVVVVTAGIPRKPGETRLDLAQKNIGVIEGITESVLAHNRDCVILMVSNPVDLMALTAYMKSGMPNERVFGLGTMLDSIRFRSMIAIEYKVKPSAVDAMILGEHGDTMFPAYSGVRINGKPVGFDKRLERVFQEVRDSAAKVIKEKGATYYAPALAAAEVVEALSSKSARVLPTSVYHSTYGVYISVPTEVSKGGATPIECNLSDEESVLFRKSAETLSEWASKLGLKK